MTNQIFNRQQLKIQKARAAKHLDKHGFLFEEAASRLAERLDDFQRQHERTLVIGNPGGYLSKALQAHPAIQQLINCDISYPQLQRSEGFRVNADEELLPFAPNATELVTSSMSLHWVNDLPGTFSQIRQILKPDGLFIANMLGGYTLSELRQVMSNMDAKFGGMAARVIPFVEVKTLGSLLQRSGFEMPITDSETITVQYPDVFTLMHDLRLMGEGNALIKRSKKPVCREWLAEVNARYLEQFSDGDGGIIATFELLTLTALTPA